MSNTLSIDEARRIALKAQGFANKRPSTPSRVHLIKLIHHLGLYQIDSVNVVARAHYLPAFSRLGPYLGEWLDESANGTGKKRKLFEYWAHEASLLPLEDFPLMKWRMLRADRGLAGYKELRIFATEKRHDAFELLERIRKEGPQAASDIEKGKTGWWAWSQSKHILEWLFYAGHVSVRERRNNFERVYDLTEKVIPNTIFDQPYLDEETAHRRLIEKAAKSLGIATLSDLRDYYRLGQVEAHKAVSQLVEDGTLIETDIKGWPKAYRHYLAKCSHSIMPSALLAPFDPLVWHRDRALRLFDFHYRLEIYVPKEKRQYGYYVLPFLHKGRLVARVDLKAHRQNSELLVHAIHKEQNTQADFMADLNMELETMAHWLNLDKVVMPMQKLS